jgi:chromosome segregation protein
MLLTKLEIKGFKSFAEPMVIHFDKGVTGIVGPNGCGKSNVVDAIRWVLGEQRSRAMRSDKMENVIFNGTSQRKPATVAQVSLTFENNLKILPAEYTYVTITRRYYRSGESEYLINDVRCRLKDITNLFLDTGIGSDSYAIIELKMVDEILNDKENSRRDLFEKAAGISKYKARKKEALARLAVVDDDLSRVGDLLFEIEKNLKNLEKQARQTERFFKLKEEYKTVSLLYAQKALSRQKETHDQLQSQIAEEAHKRDTLIELLANQETQADKEKEKLVFLERDFNSKQSRFNDHKAQLRQTENEKKLKNERLTFLQEKNNGLHEQIKTDLQAHTQLKAEIEQLVSQSQSAEKQFAEVEMEVKNLQTDYEIQKQQVAEIQQGLKSKENLYQQRQGKLFQLNKELEIKQMQLNAAKQELEKSASLDTQQQAESDLFAQEILAIQEKIDFARQDLVDYQAKEDRKQEEMRWLEQETEEMRRKLTDTQRNLDRKQNEYNLTKSLIDNMEGFPDALKYLQKDTAWGQNMPLLSDIVSCEERYRLAIENYLEPYLNYYVVEHVAEAYQAIQLLDQAQKGKANFFVLDKLPALTAENESMTKHTSEASLFFGGLNPAELLAETQHTPLQALAVVSYADEHATLWQYLLKDVYIVEHESFIIAKAEKDKSYVSIDGKVIQRNFALTGGSVGAFEGKRLGRAKNLEVLTTEIREITAQIEEQRQNLTFKQANLQSLKQNQAFLEAIRNAQTQINQYQNQHSGLTAKQEQLGRIIQKNDSQQTEIRDKIADLQAELADIRPKTQAEQAEIRDLQDQIEAMQEQFEIENERLSVQASQFNQRNVLFHQRKNELTSYEQAIRYKEQTFKDLKTRLGRQETELKQVEEELERLLETQENFEEIITKLSEQNPDWEQTVSTAEKNYYNLRGQITELEKSTKETQRRKDTQDQLLQGLQQKLHETDIALTSLKERLAVEFQILDIESLNSPLNPEGGSLTPTIFKGEGEVVDSTPLLWSGGEAELKSIVDDLRQKIDRLGVVNPMAMEAYNETKERYDFISAQKNDLVQSKEALMKTIQETEDFAKTAFMTAYNQIRDNFIKVFRSLFTDDDRADLVLTEPNNPLESKIEIIAQPKGKRPLTIDQLSGGEKTLTATSLLFALYLLKPAPFCIFDEVDAPLDDANTDKFNRIIKEFSTESQFIIVTHNKRTMASTDVMYGVTMIQQGISSVVPVDLRELAE